MRSLKVGLVLCAHLAHGLGDCAIHGLPSNFLSCAIRGVRELCCDGRYEATLEAMCHHPSLFPRGTCRNISECIGASTYAALPLTQWPMLLTHDAATGYLQPSLDPRVPWAQTQVASNQAFTSQLNCGARAFDVRPHVNNKGDLVFHHGDVEVNQDAEAALAEIVQWANQHPALEDFVLIYAWDCTGRNCSSKVAELVSKYGLRTVTQCSELNLTLSAAASLSTLPGGGHILVVSNCSSSNYNETLACSGFDHAPSSHVLDRSLPTNCMDLDTTTFDEQVACGKNLQGANSTFGYYQCWVGSSGHDFAVDRLLDYLIRVSSRPLPENSFTQLQALWQETPQSVASHGDVNDVLAPSVD